MELDPIDQTLVAALTADARSALKTLAAQCGLSAPSVAERLRRLEERGVVTGYSAVVDPRALGYQLQAIVRIKPLPGRLHEVERALRGIPQFTECDKVTGEDCFIARLLVRSLEQLDQILDSLASLAETHTAIVKTTPIARRLPPLAAG
ncbi:Lrp/AsnC family transcriptional regulator [Pseudomonas mangiferae]|uniref:Lrp/AsnC family transcriptional regulator n=1 Tax=Pseudomonas mangiferae TaxID=2593654 RepID=A0A553GVY2_9PSED|nr:Lrp/AsnC family transcriptional regulator [Pseudomonas mangiferae]TRX73645.1 Lrp/AsnC family transcriptional regulator [Pseudomonas mangiferae]